MDMIKKIACTASILLFVLSQVFSFYVIRVSQQEKIELIKEKEGKIFIRNISDIRKELQSMNYGSAMQDNVMTYCFRKNMPEKSALYQGERELFNSSPFIFEVGKLDFGNNGYPSNCKKERINGTHLFVFYDEYEPGQGYIFIYMVDITDIYQKSWRLAIQEMTISIFASLLTAILLVFLIKKITKPLQAANETQRQLIGSMSHELKTPLTAMKGYSETLLHVKLSKEQEEKALNYINRESGRLSRLSEKMMELTKLYQPECNISFQKCPVETLFEAVEENVRHTLEEKAIYLEWEGNYKGQIKEFDPDLMTSFLINLINNSAIASTPGSTIYLGSDEKSLWVRDEGCGIPREEVEKVRKAFYRVDKSRSRKSGNMGLGLALCEQIAAVHHGRMKIESEVGKGTKISWVKGS